MTTEAETRQYYIDSQLFRCGWGRSNLNLIDEFLLSGYSSYEQGDIKEFVDYVLFDQAGKPIAIVEAKKTSRDPLAGKRQASDYVDHINEQYGIEPFIFLLMIYDIIATEFASLETITRLCIRLRGITSLRKYLKGIENFILNSSQRLEAQHPKKEVRQIQDLLCQPKR